MIQENIPVTEAVSAFVTELFKEKLSGQYIYHSLKHTEEVTEAAKRIAGKMNLSDEDCEIVTIASWFHDTGFTVRAQNHEDVSIEIAEKFLRDLNYGEEKIARVRGCINATRFPQFPKNITEEILADADLYYLGTKEYDFRTELLRIEWEKTSGKIFSEKEWIKINIDFLTTHKYFTRFAKKTLDEFKYETLIKLQKRFRKIISKEEAKESIRKEITAGQIVSEPVADNEIFSDPEKLILLQNSVSFQNENIISAEKKANMMVGLNGFMLVYCGLSAGMGFINLPVIILIATNLICIVYGILALLPGKRNAIYSKEETENNRMNLLNYNNFAGIDSDSFLKGMNLMLDNFETVTDNLKKNYLSLCQETLRKNVFIKVCYIIFLFGIFASVISGMLINKFSIPEL
jgi:predicted metal-dependent HD superfamily phosphohydrolase